MQHEEIANEIAATRQALEAALPSQPGVLADEGSSLIEAANQLHAAVEALQPDTDAVSDLVAAIRAQTSELRQVLVDPEVVGEFQAAVSALAKAANRVAKEILDEPDLPGIFGRIADSSDWGGATSRPKPIESSAKPGQNAPQGDSYHFGISVYFPDGDDETLLSVEPAILRLLAALGDMDVSPGKVVRGSIFRRSTAKAETRVAHQLAERLKEVEDAIRAQQLDRPQSQNTSEIAAATAALIGAPESEPHGIICIEKLVVVKVSADQGGGIFAYSMSASELREFRERSYEKADPLAVRDWIFSQRALGDSETETQTLPRDEATLSAIRLSETINDPTE